MCMTDARERIKSFGSYLVLTLRTLYYIFGSACARPLFNITFCITQSRAFTMHTTVMVTKRWIKCMLGQSIAEKVIKKERNRHKIVIRRTLRFMPIFILKKHRIPQLMSV